MFKSTFVRLSFSLTSTHWKIPSPVLISAGCNKYRITIELTIMFRFISLKYFLDIQYAKVQITQKNSIRNNGSIATRNILKMTEFGANTFMSLSSMNQSNETKDSDDEPTISPGENMS